VEMEPADAGADILLGGVFPCSFAAMVPSCFCLDDDWILCTRQLEGKIDVDV
jgi:hypothetical protein